MHDKAHSSSIFQQIQAITSVIANIAIMVGIMFAALQLAQMQSEERRRIAIEATAPLRTTQFLSAYTRVREAAADGSDLSRDGTVHDDFYYVISIYDNIALMYVSGIADKEVITEEVRNRLRVLLPIMDATGWPSDTERKNLNKLIRAIGVNNIKENS